MKSLLENKLYQTTSNTNFFFFSKFFEIMVHLKYIKHFIKHASLMMFNEVFVAFAPALRKPTNPSSIAADIPDALQPAKIISFPRDEVK